MVLEDVYTEGGMEREFMELQSFPGKAFWEDNNVPN